jgi:hypothetical protein
MTKIINLNGYFIFFVFSIIALIQKIIVKYITLDLYVEILKFELIIFFFVIYIYTIKKSNYFNAYSLLLATTFLFYTLEFYWIL